MTKFPWFLVGLALWLCPALADVPQNPPRILDIAIENTATYSISMWVPFGSISDSIPGIAHVLEHLKFKNSDGRGIAAFDAIPGSSSNAATNYSFTRYDLSVPPAGLPEALRTLAAMTTPLVITEADLKTEKAVVTQELLQRTQSDPDTQFYLDFTSELYQGLAFERPPGGSIEQVASVTMKDVLAFDMAHYQGSTFYLQMAGPYLSPENRRAVSDIFPHAIYGDILVNRELRLKREDQKLNPLPALLPTAQNGPVSASEFTRSKQSDRARNVKMTWTKLISAPTSWRAVAAAAILQDAVRSRLPEGLRDKIADDANLVQDWSIGIGRVDEGLWQISFSASLQHGVEPAQLRKVFEEYLATFAKQGLSQQNFERLRKRDFLLSEWENLDGRIATLGEATVEFGYAKAISYLDEIKTLQLSDVNALLSVLQQPGRVGIALVNPARVAQ